MATITEIVTVTTVGYGDISPTTPVGQALSSFLMICGYGIIAVPTAIASAQVSLAKEAAGETSIACINCSSQGHDLDANFCKYCGSAMESQSHR